MENKKKPQLGIMKFTPGKPMEFSSVTDAQPSISEENKSLMNIVGESIKAYLDNVKKLLDSKYSNIKDYVPNHLREPGQVICCCCPNGIVIRYDVKTDKKPIFGVAWLDGNLEEIVPKISESVIFCHENKNFKSLIPDKGIEITLFTYNPINAEQKVLIRFKFGYDVVIERKSENTNQLLSKPLCFIGARNSFELMLQGVMGKENQSYDQAMKEGKGFLIRNIMRLPVGWEYIEVFPYSDINLWKPEYTHIWAENDILASVTSMQFRELQFNSLDPNASARAHFAKLLSKYKQLLDSNPEREEILQSYLEENPALLYPSATKVLPKLLIGKNVTDFVLQEATGDYVLVEIEPSTDPLFVKSGDTSSQLNHAQNQIVDWRRYIEDNLHTVQKELNLPGISAMPRGLIVIGRSSSLNEENKRKLISIENASPKTKIMTYDDIFENTKAIIENLLGPLWLGLGNTQVYYLPNIPFAK